MNHIQVMVGNIETLHRPRQRSSSVRGVYAFRHREYLYVVELDVFGTVNPTKEGPEGALEGEVSTLVWEPGLSQPSGILDKEDKEQRNSRGDHFFTSISAPAMYLLIL
ncbi:hypothetical protein J6590_032650 [Homalodisca vitripennis]|nr:hypothetical protein J6590_032650 [Homalodisca vitripennis]